ncbi:MAG: formylglycine-generating enzyme family protein [Opitutales bacterium]|nr:formylglycine-generating enzyme family protein [Opitutales bacterium]
MSNGPRPPSPDFVPAADPRARRGRFSFESVWARLRLPLLLLVLATLAVASLLLYTAERRTTRRSELTVSAADAEALRQRSLAAEAAFEKVRQERFELTEDDVRLLEQALLTYEEYLSARRSVGTEDPRLVSLRRRLHLLRGERLRQESVSLETAALTLAKNDEAAAAEKLRRAVACEQEIADRWQFSGLADSGRRALLDTRLRRLESSALWQKGRALEAEAEKSFAAGRYAEAAERFTAALDAENEFLARYRDVRDTAFGRAEQLAIRRETAVSGLVWEEVSRHQAAAAAAEAKADWPGAAARWQDAVDAFARLLTAHPRSQFADRAKEASIVTRLNFARFHDDIMRVRADVGRLRQALRARQADDALRLAETVLAAARRLAEAGTGVFRPESEERQELEYIASHAATIRGYLPAADRQLLPVPGKSVRMYRTEIPQGLYASLMDANPSALRREANPVESVAYADAELFARRLGWILGGRARLPTIAEHTAAAGDLTTPAPAENAWTAANTEGVDARPVGTARADARGFHDLVGNVEEWTAAEEGETRAPVVGGSVASAPVAGLAVRQVHKREKSRTLGFRIVIE